MIITLDIGVIFVIIITHVLAMNILLEVVLLTILILVVHQVMQQVLGVYKVSNNYIKFYLEFKLLITFSVYTIKYILLAWDSTCSSNGALHLVGGENSHEGVLEYCYNGKWSPFCYLDDEEASVACKQMGCSKYAGQCGNNHVTKYHYYIKYHSISFT